jgi:ubiquinone/menaquinone biosynthesis C-methylase UbiE
MTEWEKFFDQKIKIIAKEKIILDVGSGFKFQKLSPKYKELFQNCDYKTLDIDEKYKPDILADVMNIPLPSTSVDAVICKSALEHVKNPFKAADEIYRILKPGGKCFVYVPFLYPYHGDDYWRFSEEGIKYLFRKFRKIEICPVRGHFETIANLLPHTNKLPTKALITLARFLDVISEKYQSKKQVSGYNIFLVK